MPTIRTTTSLSSTEAGVDRPLQRSHAASASWTWRRRRRWSGTRCWPRSAPSRSATRSPPPVLAGRLAGRTTPIKAALLDQRVVAGLGNIYASESLFRAGCRRSGWRRPCRASAPSAWSRRSARCFDEAIAAGGSSLRDTVGRPASWAISSTISRSTGAPAGRARAAGCELAADRRHPAHRPERPVDLLLRRRQR